MNKEQILKLLNFYEQKSTCDKKAVAAVIVSDSVMTELQTDYTGEYLIKYMENNRYFGVNIKILAGSDRGCELCIEGWKGRLCPAIHAEADCLIGRAWKDTYLKTLIVSWSPCPECCKLIKAAGIGRVIVKEPRLKKPSKADCEFYNVTTYDELAHKLLLNVHYVRLWEKTENWEVAV